MAIHKFVSALQLSMQNGEIIKLSLGNYIGSENTLKQIHIKPVMVRKQLQYQFVYRHKTQDITKNLEETEAIQTIKQELATNFGIGTLTTSTQEIIFEILANKKSRLRIKNIDVPKVKNLEHNKIKQRVFIPSTNKYFQALGICNTDGMVLKNKQDKHKQIHHYLEVLHHAIINLKQEEIHIADMGSGKGYLTFALYDFLNNNLHKNAHIIGVENRENLVNTCNKIAKENSFGKLTFQQNDIANYKPTRLDVLIALHACDTATDDAIATGVQAGAQMIVVAPCCHKQIRKELERQHKNNAWNYITRHGILLERTAEMLTDSLRALILEYHGYKTKVFEFITDAHTPKNIMLIAEKTNIDTTKKQQIQSSIIKAKTDFGINKHYLETLLAID